MVFSECNEEFSGDPEIANINDQEWMWEYAIYDIEKAVYHDRVVANMDSDVFRFQRYRPDSGEIINEYELGANELLREHMNAEYEEVIDWLRRWNGSGSCSISGAGSSPRLRHSVRCSSTPMSVWRQLLRRSAKLLDQNGHAAINTTYFDRQQASAHYLKRTGLCTDDPGDVPN